MDHYTRRDALAAFKRLADAKHATIADPSWAISDPRRDGAWFLDHNATYGGYVIIAYMPSLPPRKGEEQLQNYTAEACPMGYERQPARQFVEMCNFRVERLMTPNHTSPEPPAPREPHADRKRSHRAKQQTRTRRQARAAKYNH